MASTATEIYVNREWPRSESKVFKNKTKQANHPCAYCLNTTATDFIACWQGGLILKQNPWTGNSIISIDSTMSTQTSISFLSNVFA